MNEPKASWKFSKLEHHDFAKLMLILRGAICVYYFDKLIALIDDQGRIKWRDEKYPIYIIDYLLTVPSIEDAKRN